MIRSRSHLAFIRTMPCCVAGKRDHVCEGPVQAAHYRGSMTGGVGIKPWDNWTVPLCHKAHAEQHRIGEREFQRRYGIDMAEIAGIFWLLDVDRKIDGKPKKARKPKAKKAKAKRKIGNPKFKRKVSGEVVERAA